MKKHIRIYLVNEYGFDLFISELILTFEYLQFA